MHQPAARDHVTDESILTAGEFLNALSPRAEGWGNSPGDWIFRGQRNADWKLLPTAMRGTREDHPFRKFGIEHASTMPGHQNIKHEIPDWGIRGGRLERLLEHFARELNREGLAIPRANPAVKRLVTTSYSSFPDREVFPLMALAQHHCLPTLFLDWTKRAWVAAYFAAEDAAAYGHRVREAGGTEDATHLAVWALLRGDGPDESTEQPNFYEAPASTNPNLRAQSGLFTWWSTEEDRSLDEHISWLARMRILNTNAKPLRRFLLPVSEAPCLLRLLALERIDGASMFPGVDGVVRAMKERALWDIPPA